MSFLRKNIFSTHPCPFGLDVSDLSLKAVFLERNGSFDVLESFGSVPLPLGAIVDGEIIQEDIVVKAIQTLLQQMKPETIHTRQVVCSLPEIKAFLRIITIPLMEESEAKEAIKWEIEANIPLTLDQVYYDSQVLEKNVSGEEKKMSVLVVAVSRAVVDQFTRVLEKTGLEVVGLETESIAQARCLLSEKEEEPTRLIVDIGDRRTSFLMTIGSMPCFTSSLPLSSQMMTDAISKYMRVSFEEAERMKIERGIGSFVKRDALFRAAEPIVENLVVEIERSLRFYLQNLKYSSTVDSVLLCGGGSNAVGLVPYLNHRLHIPVEFGDVWTNIHLKEKIPILSKQQSLQYSTAIGLSLRNIKTYEY